jgi:hypothetical protein
VPHSIHSQLPFGGIALARSKPKSDAPNDRFAIALHSPDGVIETGLPVCPPEKRAPKLCLQRLAAHFLQSGLIGIYRENRAFSANFGSVTADFLCPVRLCGGARSLALTLLWSNSLLTGKNTGNLRILALENTLFSL